jgi:hypothetical protein
MLRKFGLSMVVLHLERKCQAVSHPANDTEINELNKRKKKKKEKKLMIPWYLALAGERR